MTDSDQQPRMQVGHYILSVVILFVALTMLGYLIHAVILSADYQGVAHLFRAEPLFVPLLTGNLCFACAVMRKSNCFHHTNGGLLARSAKLGIALWLLWAVPSFLIDYAGQAVPIERIFMSFYETASMNEQFQEAEVVLVFDPTNRVF